MKRALRKTKKRNYEEICVDDSTDDDEFEGSGTVQCYGFGCRKPGLPNSKYCSDKCGMDMATRRLKLLAPSRISEWKHQVPLAQSHQDDQLHELLLTQFQLKQSLDQLVKLENDLKDQISTAKSLPIDPDGLNSSHELDTNSSGTFYCVSCGVEIHGRTAIKHMERCYNRFELFFTGSTTPINVFNIYCNHRFKSDGTFCKRIQVLCQEHSTTQPRIKNEVCGFPLIGMSPETILDDLGDNCRLPALKCPHHINWDKIQIAQIHLEQLRTYWKYHETMILIDKIQNSMKNRGGILGLLLHQTIDHDDDDDHDVALSE